MNRPAGLSDDGVVMKAWIGRFIRRAPAPQNELHRVAATQRLKRYTAESGYVYEYFHQGYRDAGAARRHVFQVSADRKNWFSVEVAVDDGGVREWEQANGRELSQSERYAVAKLALFAAFDEGSSPEAMRRPVHVPAARIALLLTSINL